MLQNTKEEPITLEMTPAAPASHTSCPSSSAAAPLHRKTQSFALRFPPQPKSLATFMQPPAITMRFAAARAHSCSRYNAICIHSLQNTKEEPITIETTPAAPAAHTSCPSHFTRENTRFRALASSPTQVPCNMHAAITMRFAAARAHSCSHYTAICIYALQNTKERPLETTPAAPRRTHKLPFIVRCSHFTRQNTMFRAPASSATLTQPL